MMGPSCFVGNVMIHSSVRAGMGVCLCVCVCVCFRSVYISGSGIVSSGGLAVKHSAFGANGRRFEPRKRSKRFQGLISQLTTSWVANHVKWRCRLHLII